MATGINTGSLASLASGVIHDLRPKVIATSSSRFNYGSEIQPRQVRHLRRVSSTPPSRTMLRWASENSTKALPGTGRT